MDSEGQKPSEPLTIDPHLIHVVHMGPNLDRLWKLRPEDLLRRPGNRQKSQEAKESPRR